MKLMRTAKNRRTLIMTGPSIWSTMSEYRAMSLFAICMTLEKTHQNDQDLVS